MSRFGWGATAYAGLAGLIAVALDAWGAHGVEEAVRGWVVTASRQQMWHALAILAAVGLHTHAVAGRRLFAVAIVAFGAGMPLFSGALVALALGTHIPTAPFGGTLFMIGWLALLAGALTALFRQPPTRA
ncbi:MAG: hypothetical protein CMM50_06215 [Rhodospirillaceae bacterium]|nr:hypothetical protein [Rhodospirillaceae bacterium]